MTIRLAQIVANAKIRSLSLIGLAKNVGKTTTTNYVLETLLQDKYYQANEIGITSLGLDGEATDALTGLPKPRYLPQTGLLIASTREFLLQAENEGARFDYLQQLSGRTALGPVVLARVVHPGRVIIAGPTLLRDLRSSLDSMYSYGIRLGIIDGAINRLGAASPEVTNACIVCTGASVASTPELVAHRTANVLQRLMTLQTVWVDAYKKVEPFARLLFYMPREEKAEVFSGAYEPASEAEWIVQRVRSYPKAVFFLRGALTEEFARALLHQLTREVLSSEGEIVVGDATKIFCHSVLQQRLATKGLLVRVVHPLSILALTINPYTPEYLCSPQRLLEALCKELLETYPPIIDVVSGVCLDGHEKTELL